MENSDKKSSSFMVNGEFHQQLNKEANVSAVVLKCFWLRTLILLKIIKNFNKNLFTLVSVYQYLLYYKLN